MSPRKIVAARDPQGIRPLCLGKIGNSDVIASESCAIHAAGGEFVRDIAPGEIVVIDEEGVHSIAHACGQKTGLCVFEYVYFARPDSVIDGASVHRARRRAGAFLALEHPVQADVVIGAPDSGLDAALGYAQQSGIPYGIGFLKNKYIGRTFIQPSQKLRENTVRIKLNPIADTVAGKRVVLVDDSIVRGTTSKQIVQLLREAGATEVHFRASSAQVPVPLLLRHRCGQPEKPDRRQLHHRRNRTADRGGQPGLFEHREREEDCRGLQAGLLRGLLYRRISGGATQAGICGQILPEAEQQRLRTNNSRGHFSVAPALPVKWAV